MPKNPASHIERPERRAGTSLWSEEPSTACIALESEANSKFCQRVLHRLELVINVPNVTPTLWPNGSTYVTIRSVDAL